MKIGYGINRYQFCFTPSIMYSYANKLLFIGWLFWDITFIDDKKLTLVNIENENNRFAN